MKRLVLALLLVPLLSAQNPESADFPTSVAADDELLAWRNNATTQLNGGIDASTLTVVVDDGSKFLAPTVITVDSERMKVCSIASNTLTICSGGRGYDGSSAASHSDNAAVSNFVPAYWLNKMAAEIIAIETALGANLSNVATATGTVTFTNKTIDGENNTLQTRRAATDCTAETGGKEGEQCLELDDDTLYACQPTAGDCDTAGEWVQVGGAAAFSSITAGTNTNALVIGTGGSLGASGSGTITATSGDSATSFFPAGTIELARGGTGADLSATGGANQFVRQSSAGGALTVSAIADADVPDDITIDLATQATTALAGDSATSFFSAGTLEDARLSANVGLLDTTQTYTGPKTFQGVTDTVHRIQAGSLQTSPLIDVRDNGGTTIFSVGADGTVNTGGVGNSIIGLGASMTVAGGDGVGDDLILRSTTHATPGSVTFPEFTNCNLDTDGSGNLVCGTDATGSSGSPAGVRQTFTSQTSVTITHNFGTLAYAVQCYDGSNDPLFFDGFSSRTTSAATVTFGGAVSGDCVAIPGGQEGPYVNTFTSTTSLTVTGATHGKVCATTGIQATIYDDSTPRQKYVTTPTVDYASSCDVVWGFDLALAGLVVIQ